MYKGMNDIDKKKIKPRCMGHSPAVLLFILLVLASCSRDRKNELPENVIEQKFINAGLVDVSEVDGTISRVYSLEF